MKKVKVHVLMHVAYENPGCIETWIYRNKFEITYTRFYENYRLPPIDEFDLLIVMGGPMSVHDENNYNWLKSEKEFIRKSIENRKIVVGICLGAQLIAHVLGASVYTQKIKEIGWFNIKSTESGMKNSILEGFEVSFPVFHWHGETFNLPTDSVHLFASEVCTNQAYLYDNRILGLQFHLEVTPETVRNMVKNGKTELIKSTTVQSENEIMEITEYFNSNNLRLYKLLDYLIQMSIS